MDGEESLTPGSLRKEACSAFAGPLGAWGRGSSHRPPPATYLHEEQPHDEGAALAVAHLPVHQGVRL